MNFRKFIFKSAILSVMAFSIVACSDDDDVPSSWNPPLSTTNGAYILNNGDWKANDASITYYDKATQKVSNSNVFESMNDGLHLGNLGQDMLITNNKMYIAVSGSKVIYITDLKCAIIDSIKSTREGQLQEPRAFTTYGNYVYVTYYDGYLARINRNTNKLDSKQVKVGENPEGLKIANGKIYVANSGGMSYPNYDKTVSVVDVNTFQKIKDINVVINPTKVEVDKYDNIYVISNGNYYGDPIVHSALQRIDTKYDALVEGFAPEATFMRVSPQGDKLYYLNFTYDYPVVVSAKTYDIVKDEILASSFIDSSVDFSYTPSSFDIDPQTGDYYIGVSPYTSKGEMYVISASTGKQLNKFSTDGLNPWGVYFVK